MSDRAAIVTGASRGIGLALAETLAAEGYDLTISARKPDTLEAAAERLRANGRAVEAVPATVRQSTVVAVALAGVIVTGSSSATVPVRSAGSTMAPSPTWP